MRSRHNNSAVMVPIVLLVASLLGGGCLGGGDDGEAVPTSALAPVTSVLLIPGDSGVGSVADNLSSFKAKDPFKAQAVVTTTTTTSTTIPVTTTRSTTTTSSSTTVPSATSTTIPVTTTAPHYLRVDVMLSAPDSVIYTLDGLQVWGQMVGSVYDTGTVRIEVLAIDTVARTVTFRRGYDPDYYEFTLAVSEAEYW